MLAIRLERGAGLDDHECANDITPPDAFGRSNRQSQLTERRVGPNNGIRGRLGIGAYDGARVGNDVHAENNLILVEFDGHAPSDATLA